MTNKIIEAAREAGFVVQRDEWVLQTMLRTFYAIAYRAGLEDAAAIFDQPHAEYFGREAADSIRALMKETP